MKRSKKSKGCSRKLKSSRRVTGKDGARAGRSELHCSKPRGIGSLSLTQMETSTQRCYVDLWPLRMTLISLLGAKGYVKLITGERSLPFSPGFTFAFFSELDAIRKRVSNFSEEHPSIHGPQMDFCSMLRYLRKRKKLGSRSSKSLSSAKSKNKCQRGQYGER